MELLVDEAFDGSAPLCEEESRHCVSVMRHRVGDEVLVTDGRGHLYHCRITDANSKKCSLSVVSVDVMPQPRHKLHIAVAPTKNADRLEWFVEKATEMGISEITPIVCEHSERTKLRLDRLQRLVVAASKQSLKYYLPKINEPVECKALIANATETQRFILHCEENHKEHLFNLIDKTSDILILIGPEGDFSTDEISLAKANGFREATLGDERLRTETAAMVACCVANTKCKV